MPSPSPSPYPDTATRFIVVTGGPGAGKTTLVERLAERGIRTAPEAGRSVIKDQMAIAGRALPWIDPDLFAELMLAQDMRSYRAASAHSGPVVFDRGIVDVVGYLRLLGHPVPAHLHTAAQAFPYHRRVFVAPPWPEIYARDTERKQSYEEAVRTYEAQVAAYSDYGYEVVHLPLAPVEERARFVLDHLGQETGRTGGSQEAEHAG
ncbi:AAA family ATPase [Streptomyces sp. NPDC003077]|uniref:AAA family ATPase n=1 Tax=Streptomyces sp. NPDC003077 TaxID=3154443 RepID=UPI0033A253FD